MNETKIKTFDDLDFHAHRTTDNAIQARLDLGNGLEISVVSMKNGGHGLYGNASDGTYEVAVFSQNLMLPLSAWDDVKGWQNKDELNELMSKLQGDTEKVGDYIDSLHLAKSEMRTELGLDS